MKVGLACMNVQMPCTQAADQYTESVLAPRIEAANSAAYIPHIIVRAWQISRRL